MKDSFVNRCGLMKHRLFFLRRFVYNSRSRRICTMKKEMEKKPCRPRYSGILLHPTSLPGPYGIGDLGKNAYDFIDFLDKAGQSVWQCLPLGPTGFGDSPYQSFSSFAGQPLLISPDLLVKDKLLPENFLQLLPPPGFNDYLVNYGDIIPWKTSVLKMAASNFFSHSEHGLKKEFSRFCHEEKDWLEDYALFMALKDLHGGKCWHDWEPEMIRLSEHSRSHVIHENRDAFDYYCFVQFIFFRQWRALHEYASEKHILIIGDLPIFVAPDSADIWANQDLFQLDSKGFPTAVAGVPPDYFSETGQLWGNPLYDWEAHRKTGYDWWIRRIQSTLRIVDIVRIDHFRGFEAYWSVPAGSETAIKGKWVKGPGAGLFHALEKKLGKDLPIIAEDLGIITPEVEKLRDSLHLPGMKVLQFAFDAPESDYLPYLYPENCICYTGTHDNDTTVGWYQKASEKARDKVRRYMSCDGSNIHWDFMRTAISSTARYAIFPMQDVLGYGSDCRMNQPGVAGGNWSWRFHKNVLTDDLAQALRSTCEVYGRDKARMEEKKNDQADT